MSITIKSTAKKLAKKLASYRDARFIREAAVGISDTILEEIKISGESGVDANSLIEVCFKGNSKTIPLTRIKQAMWLDIAIESLLEVK